MVVEEITRCDEENENRDLFLLLFSSSFSTSFHLSSLVFFPCKKLLTPGEDWLFFFFLMSVERVEWIYDHIFFYLKKRSDVYGNNKKYGWWGSASCTCWEFLIDFFYIQPSSHLKSLLIFFFWKERSGGYKRRSLLINTLLIESNWNMFYYIVIKRREKILMIIITIHPSVLWYYFRIFSFYWCAGEWEKDFQTQTLSAEFLLVNCGLYKKK